VCIASPCYARELTPDTPDEFLYDAPDFVESYAVHSPRWWRQHLQATGIEVLHCQEHPRGREFWLDEIRWLLEACHPRDMEPWMRQMVYREIVMLLRDDERFVTYLTLVAVKPENRLSLRRICSSRCVGCLVVEVGGLRQEIDNLLKMEYTSISTANATALIIGKPDTFMKEKKAVCVFRNL